LVREAKEAEETQDMSPRAAAWNVASDTNAETLKHVMDNRIKGLKQQFSWLKLLSSLGSGRDRGRMNKCRPTILTITLFSHTQKQGIWSPSNNKRTKIWPENLQCLLYTYGSRSLNELHYVYDMGFHYFHRKISVFWNDK
jgi:hypothetical protein